MKEEAHLFKGGRRSPLELLMHPILAENPGGGGWCIGHDGTPGSGFCETPGLKKIPPEVSEE
jgi:hypothetical protein